MADIVCSPAEFFTETIEQAIDRHQADVSKLTRKYLVEMFATIFGYSACA